MTTEDAEHLADRISRHRDGFALARYFCHSPFVYEQECRHVLLKSWLLAGHVSQIDSPGDYFQFEFAGESVILCRDHSQSIHALLNVCRHRGARVCDAEHGNSRGFTCPYHGWVYDLDGALKHTRDYPSLDRSKLGLKRLRLIEFQGLLFINFDPDADDFRPELELLTPILSAFALPSAKVAAFRSYTVDANWKLALENYLECYHCATAHRAYARSHTLKALAADVAAINAEMLANSAARSGVPGLGVEHYHAYDEALTPGGGVDCSRYALYEGFLTGSRSGSAVAPLMGSYRGYDGGAGDFQFGPLAFMLGYPDHCVLYRFTPLSLDRTDMALIWLVRADAEQGVDYDLDELTWLWDHTTQEDEYIISRNAAGVSSRFFEPGPYHPEKEAMCIAFTRWYLQRLRDGLASKSKRLGRPVDEDERQ